MVQVEISQGVLEGALRNNEYGGTFYSFKGIPYAEPPVDDLRFQVMILSFSNKSNKIKVKRKRRRKNQ